MNSSRYQIPVEFSFSLKNKNSMPINTNFTHYETNYFWTTTDSCVLKIFLDLKNFFELSLVPNCRDRRNVRVAWGWVQSTDHQDIFSVFSAGNVLIVAPSLSLSLSLSSFILPLSLSIIYLS
jgi:hypothetical protein